jgi:hypothetical protein
MIFPFGKKTNEKWISYFENSYCQYNGLAIEIGLIHIQKVKLVFLLNARLGIHFFLKQGALVQQFFLFICIKKEPKTVFTFSKHENRKT